MANVNDTLQGRMLAKAYLFSMTTSRAGGPANGPRIRTVIL